MSIPWHGNKPVEGTGASSCHMAMVTGAYSLVYGVWINRAQTLVHRA